MMDISNSQIFPSEKANTNDRLRCEAAQLKAERAKLDKAIEALNGVTGKSGGDGRATRRLSAEALS